MLRWIPMVGGLLIMVKRGTRSHAASSPAFRPERLATLPLPAFWGSTVIRAAHAAIGHRDRLAIALAVGTHSHAYPELERCLLSGLYGLVDFLQNP